MTSASRLRIAMYLSSDPSAYGGVLTHVYYLTKRLEALGHSVTLFCANKPILPFNTSVEVGKAVPFFMPNGNWVSITVGSVQEETFKDINANFDLLHVHEPYTPFVAWSLLKDVTIPKIATFHSAWDPSSSVSLFAPLNSFILSNVFSRIDAAVYTSAVTRRCWADWTRQIPIAETIPLAIADSYHPPVKRKKNAVFELLFVARLVPKKGLYYVLQTLKAIHHKFPIHLTVVGDGSDKVSMETYVQRHNLESVVTFTGAISERDKIRLYQQADLFLAPYIDEGFGFTVFEAIASGVPIVGFQNAAFSDTLLHYPDQSLFVAPQDVHGLQRAIEKVIQTQKLHEQLKEWCIRESGRYRWDAITGSTENLYYRVLSGKTDSKTG